MISNRRNMKLLLLLPLLSMICLLHFSNAAGELDDNLMLNATRKVDTDILTVREKRESKKPLMRKQQVKGKGQTLMTVKTPKTPKRTQSPKFPRRGRREAKRKSNKGWRKPEKYPKRGNPKRGNAKRGKREAMR